MTRRQAQLGIGGLAAIAALCYFFPLFHVRALDRVDGEVAAGSATVVSAKEFAGDFWKNVLPAEMESAADIESLFDVVDDSPKEARRRFGRQVGIGGASYFFVRGVGTVEQVSDDRCVLTIGDRSRRVCVETGVIVGNAIRDATGLIDVNSFASSQEFNSVSDELNHKVEDEVIAPILQQLKMGAVIRFVGCSQVKVDADFDPLCIHPIHLEAASLEDSSDAAVPTGRRDADSE